MTAENPAARRGGIDRAQASFVGWITSGHFLIHWYQQIFPVVIPTIKSALGLNDVQVGALSSARLLAGGVLTLPSGMFSDAFGRQRPLVLASAVVSMGVGVFITGLVPTFGWVFAGVLLMGAGTAVWHPTAISSLSLKYPHKRGTMLSIHGTGATIADTFAPVAIGALIAVFAWQPVLILHLIPALAIAYLVWRNLKPSFGDTPPREFGFRQQVGDVGSLLRNGPFLAITVATGAWAVGRQVVLTFLPIYLQEDLGYSTVVLGIYIGLLHALGIVSQSALGVMSDKFGRKIVLVPSFLLLGLLYIALAFAPPGIALAAVIAGAGLFFYTLANITNAATLDVVGSRGQAATVGFQSMLLQVLILPAPIFAGLLVISYGIGAVFIAVGALMLFGAALMIPLRMHPGGRGGSSTTPVVI